MARALVMLTRHPPRRLRTATVNGAPGLVVVDADGVLSVIAFTVDGGRITAIDVGPQPGQAQRCPGAGLRRPDPAGAGASLLAGQDRLKFWNAPV